MKTLSKHAAALLAMSLALGSASRADESSANDLTKRIDAVNRAVGEAQKSISKIRAPVEQIVAQVHEIAREAQLEPAFAAQDVDEVRQLALAAEPAAVFDNSLNRRFELKGDRPGWFNPDRRPAQALVISARPIEPAAVSAIEEDLTVMSHILRKEVDRESGPDKPESAMGIYLSASAGSRPPEAIYLEGYGALFLLNVRFPLLAPPAREETKPEPAGDSSWEKAKQELYGPRDSGGMDELFRGDGRERVEFDAERVENLKKALFNALKNAANIRNVQPDESVVITVIGGANAPGAFGLSKLMTDIPRVAGVAPAAPGHTEKPPPAPHNPPAPAAPRATPRLQAAVIGDARGGAAGRTTVLTIHAKKSDIDAFAKGRMDLDEFRRKTALNVYWGSAGNLQHGPAGGYGGAYSGYPPR